jgi:formyltetrahydrofolate-dependent phosphoribosylglycinamide formyltransferase
MASNCLWVWDNCTQRRQGAMIKKTVITSTFDISRLCRIRYSIFLSPMFNRLREKWGVTPRRFWIIFIAFGLTGTTAAILTRYITGWLGFDADTHWAWKLALRLSMLLIGYQLLLLFYGFILGEGAFFWKYERKLLEKLGILKRQKSKGKNQKEEETLNAERGTQNAKLFIHKDFQTPDSKLQTPDLTQPQTPNPKPQTNIAIFASGAGSNAEKIIHHLQHHATIKVTLVVCNKPGAGVLGIANANGIPTLLIEKERFFREDAYLPVLQEMGIDFIVLAGFLWKVPSALISAYPGKIINIHPALLPKYGGKGMYGMKVHESVIAAKEKESGITIHYVNEHFDEGEHIFQARCPIEETDTPESLAQKIHALEHAHFPAVVERIVGKNEAS